MPQVMTQLSDIGTMDLPLSLEIVAATSTG